MRISLQNKYLSSTQSSVTLLLKYVIYLDYKLGSKHSKHKEKETITPLQKKPETSP